MPVLLKSSLQFVTNSFIFIIPFWSHSISWALFANVSLHVSFDAFFKGSSNCDKSIDFDNDTCGFVAEVDLFLRSFVLSCFLAKLLEQTEFDLLLLLLLPLLVHLQYFLSLVVFFVWLVFSFILSLPVLNG